MIPFRDNIPSRTTPFITVLIIILNVLAFLFELSLNPRALQAFMVTFGVVPARFFVEPFIMPFITSMFLHGGWMHLIGNMWYLWIFGDNIEDKLGHFRFFIFYLLCGLGAGIVHTILNANSIVPSVGASGAIAGVLGAYMIAYPGAKVLTLVPIFIFIQVIELPALIVLFFWFIVQLFSGMASLAVATASQGGVAFWAHIGGFIIGMILLGILGRKPRYDYYPRY